jgi:protein-tyrosine phosphatase
MASMRWIEPRRLLAGAYPRNLDALVDGRVTLVVDLTDEGELEPYVLPSTIRHVRAAIPDFGVPSEEELRRTLDLIDSEPDGVVFVHCRGGCGRTGTVVGCWLVRHGATPAEALARVAPCPETAEQRALIERWTAGR